MNFQTKIAFIPWMQIYEESGVSSVIPHNIDRGQYISRPFLRLFIPCYQIFTAGIIYRKLLLIKRHEEALHDGSWCDIISYNWSTSCISAQSENLNNI